MEVQNSSQGNNLLDRRSFAAQFGVFNSTDLSLRTQEGDLVKVSLENDRQFAESQSEEHYADGSVRQEFSTVALAASRYSLAVEGDLNEEELAAIELIVDRISPIATNFFTNSEFDLESASDSLSESLGVIEELALELEQTLTATFSSEEFSQITQEENPDVASLENVENGALGFPQIRDISKMVLAAVETEFPARAVEVAGSKMIINSLRELMEFLREELIRFLKPLSPESIEARSAEESGVKIQEVEDLVAEIVESV